MERISILYIDDEPDTVLSQCLDKYKHENCEFEYSDIIFSSKGGYESLIGNLKVRSANIIFIDSKLFKNKTAGNGKFTGEEFKMILKKYFPFIEVVVITQNEIAEGYETIPKFNSQNGENVEDYYNNISNIMEAAIKNICELRKIAVDIKNNTNWDSVLVEKILNSLAGGETYNELTKEDIDHVISIFTEIQEKMDD